MNISLELIDEMRKRTNCSYEEAKELLQKNNGDLVDAIVEFERKHRHGGAQRNHEHAAKHAASFADRLKDLVDKGFKTRFIIEKGGSTILNISVNILILVVILTLPIFWFYPIALIGVYFLGFKIRIKKEKGEDIDVNKMVDKFGGNVKEAVDNAVKEKENKNPDRRNEVNTNDGYNETTIE